MKITKIAVDVIKILVGDVLIREICMVLHQFLQPASALIQVVDMGLPVIFAQPGDTDGDAVVGQELGAVYNMLELFERS